MAKTYEESFQEKYRKAADPMHDRVDEAVKASGQTKSIVYYSAYESTKEGIPIDNLDDIPMKGKIMIVDDGSTFYGDGEGYKSKILDNPTWLDLCVVANEMIFTTKDFHHIFLESIISLNRVLTLQDMTEVKVFRFSMGS